MFIVLLFVLVTLTSNVVYTVERTIFVGAAAFVIFSLKQTKWMNLLLYTNPLHPSYWHV